MKETITWGDRIKMAWFAMTAKRFTNGPKVREFEEKWSEWLGCDHSLFVSSGSTANFLLVAAVMERYGIKPGDKVLLPTCTWMTNVAPCLQLGLQPVFCDVDTKTFSYEINHLLKLSREHDDIRLVFITHLLGLDAPVEQISILFPNAKVIQDICESHGVEVTRQPVLTSSAMATLAATKTRSGRKRGSRADYGKVVGSTFSFYFGHHMTTIEGGMVSTNDETLYELMRMKRSHGMARESSPNTFANLRAQHPSLPPQFLFVTDGYNFRNHEICAVLGLSQLKRLDSMIAKRRANYAAFVEGLEPLADHFHIPERDGGNSSFCLPIVAKEKQVADLVKQMLDKNSIEWRPVVSGNLLKQPFLAEYAEGWTSPKNTIEIIHENGLYVGNNHFVEPKEVKGLIEILTVAARLAGN